MDAIAAIFMCNVKGPPSDEISKVLIILRILTSSLLKPFRGHFLHFLEQVLILGDLNVQHHHVLVRHSLYSADSNR